MKYKNLPIIFLCITIILLLIIFLFRDEIGEIKVDGSQKTPLSNSNIGVPPIPAISIKKDKNKLHHVQETVIKEQNFDNFELPTSPTKKQFLKNFEDSVSDGMEIDNVGGFGDFGKKFTLMTPKQQYLYRTSHLI